MKPNPLLSLVVLLAPTSAWASMAMALDLAAALPLEIESSPLVPVPHRVMAHHGVPILKTPLKPEERLYWEAYNTTTFLTVASAHRTSLYLHMALIGILAVFAQPVALVLRDVQSSWYLPLAALNLGLLTVALIALSVFGRSVPDLYPGNVYTKLTWILVVATYLQFGCAVLHHGAKWFSGDEPGAISKYEAVPLATMEMADIPSTPVSLSSTLFESISPSSSFELQEVRTGLPTDSSTQRRSRSQALGDSVLAAAFAPLFRNRAVQAVVSLLGAVALVGYAMLTYPCWLLMFVYVPTGLATVGCLGMGNKIFNILAHFIKGGVFFSIGVVALARYLGAFASKGWAWNQHVVTGRLNRWDRLQPKGLITMEMIESALILFYGVTNVFMEHLASPGGAWTAKDLQHVSIAFLYIGGGLCGVVTELKLSQWRFDAFLKANHFGPEASAAHITGGNGGYSPNPFPAFTVFWTGILMSKHAQASEIATTIHVQWGTLLSYGSLFRCLTIILMYLKPIESRDFKPSRPMTELITSFTLLAGGVIFMESTDPVVLAMEYRGLTAMFTLNVSVGCVALLMAWIMSLFALRDWMRGALRGPAVVEMDSA